jgi:hypothetical protein
LLGGSSTLLADGTVTPTDRVGVTGFWSGKRRCPGENVQTVADLHGFPLWFPSELGASTHDRAAVTVHGMEEALAGRMVLADLGHLGTWCRTPDRKPKGGQLSEVSRAFNRCPSSVRAPVGWVFAALKQWRCLRRFRPSPGKVGVFVAAIRVLTWWGW